MLLHTRSWHLAVVVMTVVGVLAVGVHASLIASAAAGVRSPAAAAAAADDGGGIPVPALVAGALLAFAVGLAGGHARRRRRSAREPEPAPAPEPEPEPAPAEPEPQPPAPTAAPAPEPEPEPAPDEPEPQPPAPAAAPAPEPEPAPDELEPEPYEVYEDEEVAFSWRREGTERPWPEAAELWSCQIAWKPGYRKSSFRAMAGPPGARKRRPIGESAPIRWTLMGDADPDVPEVVDALRELMATLEAAGWDRTEPGDDWFQQRFLWRRPGEPGPLG